MEIEAKFRIPDADVFERLLALEALGTFTLGPVRIVQVHDAYLDSSDRLILASGYSCRRRAYDDRVIVTLKSVRKGEGPIHRREEYEVSLTAPDESLDAWPDSPVRDQVRELIGAAPLGLLFEMNQIRHVRPVHAGDRSVAELSLDLVELSTDSCHFAYYELEVELGDEGSEDDLLAIVAHLRNEWGLQAEPLSKFEQALVLISDASVPERLLTPAERATCVQLARRSDLYGRRAAALLALDDGATQAAAGQAARMSERRVRHWISEFRDKRLGIFPAPVLAATGPSLGMEDDLLAVDGGGETPRPAPQPWPMDLLLDRHNVDRAHARMVADTAVLLFDELRPIHGLSPTRRDLVSIAAQLHDIGQRSDPARHHVIGHDLLLRHPPAGLSEQEHRIVAFVALAHSRKARPGKIARWSERLLSTLPTEARAEALALAALVRLADGLDYSQGRTQVARVEVRSEAVTIEVTGPFASVDAERAAAKGDLWCERFGVPVTFRPVLSATDGQPVMTPAIVAPGGGSAPVPRTKKAERKAAAPVASPAQPIIPPQGKGAEPIPVPELPAEPGLLPDDTMAEGARKTLWFHFQRMLAHEAGTRLGEDPEELHDMRVATRRMRAALPIFMDYLDMDVVQPYVKGLRRTGRVLGAVRDLDVFYEKTQSYLATLPPERRSELDPLLEAWCAQREHARATMLAYLDSQRYARFVEQFGEFLSSPGAGALPTMSASGEPVPHRLRHVVPVALYRRLAEVRAFDEWLTGPDVPLSRYHQLRIASKGLRYALEYFREILGPTAKPLIDAVKGLQDLLGDANDAVVACNLLRDYLTWGTWGHSPDQASFADSIIVSPGAAAYLAYRQTELQGLLARFPEVWATFHGHEFGRWLADAVAEL